MEVLAESEEKTTDAPAKQEETEDTGETTVVESNLPRLGNSVRLTSMFDQEAALAAAETAVNNPDYVCVAAHFVLSGCEGDGIGKGG